MTVGEERLTFLQRIRDCNFNKVALWEFGMSLFFVVIAVVGVGRYLPYVTFFGDVFCLFAGWVIVLSLLNKFLFRATALEWFGLMLYIFLANLFGFGIGLVILRLAFGLN